LLWDIVVPESADVQPSASGPGRLRVAARGDVIVLAHAAGSVVYGDGDARAISADWAIDASGSSLQLVRRGEIDVLAGRAPPALEERITRNGSSLGMLGPSGELQVTLPEAAVQFTEDQSGVLLRALLPAGAVAAVSVAFVAATDNRY